LPNGYMGRILRVDLTAGTLRAESLSNDVAKKYLGGKGYSVYLLYQYLREYESKGISAEDINGARYGSSGFSIVGKISCYGS